MFKWFESGIFRKMLGFILAIAVIPYVAMGGAALWSTQQAGEAAVASSCKALDAKSAEALELRAIETAQAIARFLKERENDLRTLAVLPPDADVYLTFDMMHQAELWMVENEREVRRSVPLYKEIAYIDANGQEQIKITDGRLAAPGELVNVSNPRKTLYKSETYFQEAQKLPPGEIYVGHVTGFYVSKAQVQAGQRFSGVLRFAMPVVSGGRLVGVVALALNNRHLQEFVAHIVPTEQRFAVKPDITTGNYAYIIDNRAGTIAHPGEHLMMGLDADGQPMPYAQRAQDIGMLPPRLDQMDYADKNLSSIHARAMSGEAGSIQYWWDNKDKFAAFAPIPYYGGSYAPPGGFGWVGIAANAAEFHKDADLVSRIIQERARMLVVVVLLILVLTGIAVVVIAALLTRQIATPVRQLTTAAQAVEQGDFRSASQLALDIRSRDELGFLARSFHKMATQLQETLAGLEYELGERKRVELALRESEQKYRTLFDGVPVGLYRSTPRGQFLDANLAMVHMLKYPDRATLLDINAADTYVNARAREVWKTLMSEQEVVRDYQFQVRRYDGSTIWVENTARAVKDEQGRILHYEGSLEDITERKQAEEALRQYQDHLQELVDERTAALNTLTDIGKALSATLDARSLLNVIAEQTGRVMYAENLYVALYHPAADEIEFAFDSRPNRPRSGHRRKLANGLTDYVLRTRRPLFLHGDVNQQMADLGIELIGEPAAAWIGVPLLMGERVLGVLSVQHYADPQAYNDNHVELLQSIANQASIALENARLFGETQRRVAELATLTDIGQALSATLDMRSLLEVIAEQAGRVMYAENLIIALHHQARREIELVFSSSPQVAPGTRMPVKTGLIGHIIQTRQSLLIRADQDTLQPMGLELVGPPAAAWLGVPMVTGERVLGVISVQHYTDPRAYDESHRVLLETIASQAAIALDNARLYAEARKRITELSILNEMGRALASALNTAELLDITYQQVGRIFDATNFFIATCEADSATWSAALQVENHQRQPVIHYQPAAGLVGFVIRARRPLLLKSAADLQAFLTEHELEMTDRPPRSWAGVPLLVGKRVVGVMALESYAHENLYGEQELALLSTISSQVAIATENARLYQQVQREKQYFESLVLNSPTAIVVTDLQHRVTGWNPSAEKLFGYAPAEAIGRNIDNLVATEETLWTEAISLSQQTCQGALTHAITRRCRKDGSLVDVELFGVPVLIGQEQVGSLAIYHDITELQHARQQAEAANQAKSAFLANMSHELRTPLNAIIGYSEMLQEEAEETGYTDLIPDLQKINTAGKHLLMLINDILDLSKIEAGRMQLYLETFDPATLVQDVTVTVRPLIEKNGNTLQVRCAEKLGQMHSDQTKVRQALFNLLSNAAKFTQQGVITLTAELEEQPAPFIIFTVSDTGIGMTAEQLGKLFQPFTQADASTTRKYGGTGLGLTITKHFCQMLGGDITAASEPGRGSTFTIRLPCQSTEDKGKPAESPRAAALPTGQPQAATVLVIDDDPTARDLIQRSLLKEGFRVECAADGKEGLELVRQFRPDVITLDVMMPHLDGWAVLSRLKADPELAHIPVIMLTIVDDKRTGFALGASDYISKPIDRERLITTVKKYTGGPLARSALIVEDDPATREVMRRTLEAEGWTVNEAENGQVGLARLAESAPGLILLDLMMPEMDGFEFVIELRQNQAWRSIPVIVVTAKDLTDEDRLRLNGYVEKIIHKSANTRDELLNRVRELVAMHVRQKSAQTQ